MKYTLRALRVNNQLTQEEAAKLLDVSEGTVSSWELSRTFPNVRQIEKITRLYKVTYDDIIFLNPNTV